MLGAVEVPLSFSLRLRLFFFYHCFGSCPFFFFPEGLTPRVVEAPWQRGVTSLFIVSLFFFSFLLFDLFDWKKCICRKKKELEGHPLRSFHTYIDTASLFFPYFSFVTSFIIIMSMSVIDCIRVVLFFFPPFLFVITVWDDHLKCGYLLRCNTPLFYHMARVTLLRRRRERERQPTSRGVCFARTELFIIAICLLLSNCSVADTRGEPDKRRREWQEGTGMMIITFFLFV